MIVVVVVVVVVVVFDIGGSRPRPHPCLLHRLCCCGYHLNH